jgi:hypothetical protein
MPEQPPALRPRLLLEQVEPGRSTVTAMHQSPLQSQSPKLSQQQQPLPEQHPVFNNIEVAALSGALAMCGSNATLDGIERVTAYMQRSFTEVSQWFRNEVASGVFLDHLHRIREASIPTLPGVDRPRGLRPVHGIGGLSHRPAPPEAAHGADLPTGLYPGAAVGVRAYPSGSGAAARAGGRGAEGGAGGDLGGRGDSASGDTGGGAGNGNANSGHAAVAGRAGTGVLANLTVGRDGNYVDGGGARSATDLGRDNSLPIAGLMSARGYGEQEARGRDRGLSSFAEKAFGSAGHGPPDGSP